MYILHHQLLCPFSRQIRIYLSELSIQYKSVQYNQNVKINSNNNSFHKEYVTSFPVLTVNDDQVISGIYPILEYLIESYEDKFILMPKEDKLLRASIRECTIWFNDNFYRESLKILLNEKIVKLLNKSSSPKSEYIKLAKNNAKTYLNNLSNLVTNNTYVLQESISIADIAAACHISVMDYLGEINWDNVTDLHYWYSIIKSRPSFQILLKDYLHGFPPSYTYNKLDF